MTQFAASTHPGLIRNHNEDSFESNQELGLWLVADGVGGHSGGEVASAIVRDTMVKEVAAGTPMVEAVHKAHRAVLDEIQRRNGASDMGSTLVALKLDGKQYELVWVGDSRAYVFDGGLRQLSRDHNPVSELLATGAITADQAATHPDRHVLSQSMGVAESIEVKPGHVSGQLEDGQQILLCSDGLSDEVRDEGIAQIMGQQRTPQTQVDALVNMALANGGRDNISVVIVGEPAHGGEGAAPLTHDLETTQNIGQAISHGAADRVNHSGKIWLLVAVMVIAALWLWL
jgi:protein phosphatase